MRDGCPGRLYWVWVRPDWARARERFKCTTSCFGVFFHMTLSFSVYLPTIGLHFCHTLLEYIDIANNAEYNRDTPCIERSEMYCSIRNGSINLRVNAGLIVDLRKKASLVWKY